MWFRVDPKSSVPVYQQVIRGIRQGIARGIVQPGDRLPSVRDLATEMTLNPNTVAKAYRELEHLRVITVIQGRGTFVAELLPDPDRARRLQEIISTMQSLLVDAHHIQMSPEELDDLFHGVVRDWEESKERGERR